MAFEQTRDVFEHVREFHQSLSTFYEELEDSAEKERARILLNYMSRHEQYLSDCLTRYEEQVSDSVLDTYFQYESESTPLEGCPDIEIDPQMSVEDVMAAAMRFDASLVGFYEEMARRATTAQIREVFENLLAMEKQEQVELSKKVLGIQIL